MSKPIAFRWMWSVSLGGCLLICARMAEAQYAVRQNGRLFDANPQLGSGGYNAGRPVSPLMLGNALTQGTIGRGLSLSPVSPIGDPTAFRASLGSGLLSGFRRDSVSAADAVNPYLGLVGLPYYDPALTVPTTGFLTGQSAIALPTLGPTPVPATGITPGGGTVGPAPLDLRIDSRLNSGVTAFGDTSRAPGALRSQIVGLAPGETPDLSGTSSIFGPTPRGSTGLPLASEQAYKNLNRPLAQMQRGPDGRLVYETPQTQEPVGAHPLLGTPEDLVRSRELQTVTRSEQSALGPSAAERRALNQPSQTPGPVARAKEPGEPLSAEASAAAASPRLHDLSVLPGYDVFTDMQLGLALASKPDAPWWKEMQTAIRQNPAASRVLNEKANLESSEFVNRVVNSPIRSFHGQGETALNNELLKAESLLEIGQYYEAAHRYDAAHRLDPLNPLPLVGKGNALLAAGDYLSAVVSLIQGFERYPELSRFSFDLSALMGGGEVVDIRRADLIRRLQGEEEARLRFLLGYLEYFGGDKDSGLRNFEKAADDDAGKSIISRFPAMLRGGKLPPPKMPSDAAPGLPDRDQPPAPSGAGLKD